MLEAGLRVGEVTNLRTGDLNMTTCQLRIENGKGAKDRVLWISEDLRDEIGEWLERRPESDEGWMFPTRTGKATKTSGIRRAVKKYAKKAGIIWGDDVSPHTMRHTFATNLLRKTGNIRLVQKALGHADLSTTMIYTHIVDDELESALKGMAG